MKIFVDLAWSVILAHCHFNVALLPPWPVSYALPAMCILFAPVLFVLHLFRFCLIIVGKDFFPAELKSADFLRPFCWLAPHDPVVHRACLFQPTFLFQQKSMPSNNALSFASCLPRGARLSPWTSTLAAFAWVVRQYCCIPAACCSTLGLSAQFRYWKKHTSLQQRVVGYICVSWVCSTKDCMTRLIRRGTQQLVRVHNVMHHKSHLLTPMDVWELLDSWIFTTTTTCRAREEDSHTIFLFWSVSLLEPRPIWVFFLTWVFIVVE